MSKGWLAPKLKWRADLCQSTQTPNSTNAGFDREYTTLTTIWCGIRETGTGNFFFSAAIRGEQVDIDETHEFIIRLSAVNHLGTAFASAFAGGFDSIADINPVKSEYFLKVKSGTYKGRLFRVERIKRDDEYKAFLRIRVREVEEYGTGWPA